MKAIFRSMLVVGLTLMAFLSACAPASTASSAQTVASATPVSAQRTASANTVTASISVVPAETSNLAFGISGLVKQIDVKMGDQVHAGQTLIVLDTPSLDSDLQSAQARV